LKEVAIVRSAIETVDRSKTSVGFLLNEWKVDSKRVPPTSLHVSSAQAVWGSERPPSVAVEESLRWYFDKMADFDLVLRQVLFLGRRLDQGAMELHSVIDVEPHVQALGRERSCASWGSEALRRAIERFERVERLRLRYRGALASADDKRALVDAVQQLSLHPKQLQKLDIGVGRTLNAIGDAEGAIREAIEASGHRLTSAQCSASALRASSRPVCGANAPERERAVRVRRHLEVLEQVERDAGERLSVFREHATSLRDAYLRVERAKKQMGRHYPHGPTQRHAPA